MTKDEARRACDLLECLQDVMTATDDLGNVEWEKHEPALVDLSMMTSDTKQTVAFLHRVPVEVLRAGLLAMAREIERMVPVAQGEPA